MFAGQAGHTIPLTLRVTSFMSAHAASGTSHAPAAYESIVRLVLGVSGLAARGNAIASKEWPQERGFSPPADPGCARGPLLRGCALAATEGPGLGSDRAEDGPVTSALAVPGEPLPWLVAGEGLSRAAIWGSGGAGAGFATGSSRDGWSIGALVGATGTSWRGLASGRGGTMGRAARVTGGGGAAGGDSGLGLSNSTGMTAHTLVRPGHPRINPPHERGMNHARQGERDQPGARLGMLPIVGDADGHRSRYSDPLTATVARWPGRAGRSGRP